MKLLSPSVCDISLFNFGRTVIFLLLSMITQSAAEALKCKSFTAALSVVSFQIHTMVKILFLKRIGSSVKVPIFAFIRHLINKTVKFFSMLHIYEDSCK